MQSNIVGKNYLDLTPEELNEFLGEYETDYCGYCGVIWLVDDIHYNRDGFSREVCPKCIGEYET